MNIRHFSLIEFVAYQRGELPSRQADQMEGHLQDGCPACGDTLGFVQRLVETAQRDRAAIPPPGVLERAVAVFRSNAEPLAEWIPAVKMPAHLIFDSFLQPVATGFRSAIRLDRHLVFEEHDLLLDVHLEPDMESGRQSITGQLQSSATAATENVFRSLPVMLVEGPKVVLRTRTNDDGEFVFAAAPRREMGLCVVCQDRVIRTPNLPPVTTE